MGQHDRNRQGRGRSRDREREQGRTEEQGRYGQRRPGSYGEYNWEGVGPHEQGAPWGERTPGAGWQYGSGGSPGMAGAGYGYGTGGRTPYGEGQGGWPSQAMGTGTPGYATGGHAGKGPKGYRRSDDRILEDVCDRLAAHPDVDASEVEVSVEDGTVMLKGFIDSRQAKRLAEDVIEEVSGVRDVSNQLRVGRGEGLGASEVSRPSPRSEQASSRPRSR